MKASHRPAIKQYDYRLAIMNEVSLLLNKNIKKPVVKARLIRLARIRNKLI